MSIHIDASDALHLSPTGTFALACPHCARYSPMSVLASPRFSELQRHRPTRIGVVFRCHACDVPVFMNYEVRDYGFERIDIAPEYSPRDSALERFAFDYLPDEAEILFREALAAYSANLFNAFAAMCRRTAQVVFKHLGENGRLQMFDDLTGIRRLADLDPEMFVLIKKVLFDTDADTHPSLPLVAPEDAAIVLEVVRDLLHQAYVRRGRLQDAAATRRKALAG
jgi:hypothetical protein